MPVPQLLSGKQLCRKGDVYYLCDKGENFFLKNGFLHGEISHLQALLHVPGVFLYMSELIPGVTVPLGTTGAAAWHDEGTGLCWSGLRVARNKEQLELAIILKN